MSERHFVIVNIDHSSTLDRSKMTELLDSAVDWVEYDKNSWLVWTRKNSSFWYRKLKPAIPEDTNIFVSVVDVRNRAGWMPKEFWKFIRDKQE
ncbi:MULTISPECIES: hypothetical protein [Rhizobium/Agrobacterium group]|uniref:hypothetical protein n=1 Tax=Rhizobium/Agrobacterium group TaxID=227290 RepID=UPI0023006DF7|nr:MULTISPECIES: hypothetical protein [Rhizobium/Agrobacterium group]MDA5633409.1 hypothetical protein [Agrobacterium sp. ST15.16.024]MDF1889053.1 hypothetical protein [Rhizobium rhizogenes]